MVYARSDLCHFCPGEIGVRLDYAGQFFNTDLSQGISVGISITATLSDLNQAELPVHLLLALRFSVINSPLVQQFEPINIPLAHHCVVTDISILELVQLLQVELRQPEPPNPILAASIIQVLAVHVLRQCHAS